jgi:hypothetical protein
MERKDLHRRVWDEMLFAGMRANYFGELVSRYQHFEKAIRVFVLVASSSAAATVLTSAAEWVKFGLPLLAAGGSFWLLFSQYSMLARDAADLRSGWCSLEAEYERLFNHLDDAGSEAVFDQIYERGNGLSKAGTKFPSNKKRLSYWLDEVAQVANARYA